jgi:hypothetical protein
MLSSGFHPPESFSNNEQCTMPPSLKTDLQGNSSVVLYRGVPDATATRCRYEEPASTKLQRETSKQWKLYSSKRLPVCDPSSRCISLECLLS